MPEKAKGDILADLLSAVQKVQERRRCSVELARLASQRV
jgi:hypothetical protein